ncbi:MAG: hypothetical protein GXY40_09985 [Syntrophomonadaceae bacterium]|nr:hypothetical protein [Syntrophomonadaceae bacterium]
MNKFFLRVSAFFLSLILFVAILPYPTSGEVKKETSKKVIILISDYIDTSDLINAYTPNLNALLQKSGSALMNIRAKNRYPASSYMSLATASRIGTIQNAGLSYNSQELVNHLPGFIEDNSNSPPQAGSLFSMFTASNPPPDGVVNLFIEPSRKYAATYNPTYQVGSFGLQARELGLQVAVLGNSDTRYSICRDAVILAMDEKGIVPCGNVSQNLLDPAPRHAGGLQSNHKRIIDNMNRLLKTSDILVIDLGDTSRVELSRANAADPIAAEQRKMAVERNDQLLGNIINNIDMDNTMLIMLTPNPNKEMLSQGNFGLTPVFIYTPGQEPGLLTSNTTRRPGLLSNYDLQPAVFSYLGNNYSDPGISTIKSNHSLQVLDEQLTLFCNLRASRNPLHYTFMLFAILGTLIGSLAFIVGRKEFLPYVNYIVYSTLSMPLVFLFISFSKYFSPGGVILISLVAALLMGALIQSIFKDPLDALLFLTAITTVLLMADCFTGSRLMLLSPLGSDAIAGGRFYGIGNDYMGALLACTIIATLLLLARLKSLKPVYKTILGLLPMLIATVVIGHPRFGANMGGFITAMVSTGFFLIINNGRKISLKQVFLIGLLAILGVFALAQLDAMFNPTPSHAGKAISTLYSGAGITVVLSIIQTKLGILASTIYNSSWSLILVLLASILALLKWKTPNIMLRIAVEYPAIDRALKILLITAVTVFVVNDTGVIAAALIMLYLLNSLWLAISSNGYPKQGRC